MPGRRIIRPALSLRPISSGGFSQFEAGVRSGLIEVIQTARDRSTRMMAIENIVDDLRGEAEGRINATTLIKVSRARQARVVTNGAVLE